MQGCQREDPEAGGDARFAERGSRGRRRDLGPKCRERENERSVERDRERKGAENFEKIAVEAALKKENRDAEREGASLPAARVQARKWKERERETRLLRWIGTRDPDLNGSVAIENSGGPHMWLTSPRELHRLNQRLPKTFAQRPVRKFRNRRLLYIYIPRDRSRERSRESIQSIQAL